MITHCTECQHEAQCVKNNEPCSWCNAPMKAIGDDYMSNSDGSLSTDEPLGGTMSIIESETDTQDDTEEAEDSMDLEQLSQLEQILLRETSIIDPDDVDLLMSVIIKEMT